MNYFRLLCIIGITTSFGITLFILIKAKHNKTARIFAGVTASSGLWTVGGLIFSGASINNFALALRAWQIGYFGVIFTVVFFVHFVDSFFESNNKRVVHSAYILGLIFLFLTWYQRSNLFLGNLQFVFNSFYWHDWSPNKNLLFLLFYFIFYWGLLGYSFFIIVREFKKSVGAKRLQIRYFMIGTIIGWIGAEGHFLPDFHIYSYNFTLISILFIAIYPIFIAYAIIRHDLLDLNIFFRKTLIYSILIALITTLYFIIIYLFESTFRSILGYHSIPLAVFIITIFSIIFNPLKNKIQKLIDKYFFKGSIDQINEENTRLRDELQKSEKMKAVATLAAGMAHEIKNPLTSIKTFTEYIDKKKDDPDFINKFKEVVGPEVDRINHIVKQLLEFSKPSELELKKTNINDLLTETLDLLNNNLITRNIKVEKHLNDIPTIKVDPNQLKQVFLNLFLNAIEAINHNGTITVSTGHVDRATGHVNITIKDSGIGIPDNHIQKIFDPFYTNKDSGTGLGLSVVHGIIEKHNGTIEVFSKINEWTEFTINL